MPRLAIVVVSALTLASCDAPRFYTKADADRLEVAEVNARRAIARANEATDRIDDLERKMRYGY